MADSAGWQVTKEEQKKLAASAARDARAAKFQRDMSKYDKYNVKYVYKAIMAVDVENYVKNNGHVGVAIKSLLQSLDPWARKEVETRCIQDWPFYWRLTKTVGGKSFLGSEWEFALRWLVEMLQGFDTFDGEPRRKLMQAVCQFSTPKIAGDTTAAFERVGRVLREDVTADIRDLKAYRDELHKVSGGVLSQENVCVVLVGDARPSTGDALEAHRCLREQKLRGFVSEGLITPAEFDAFKLRELTQGPMHGAHVLGDDAHTERAGREGSQEAGVVEQGRERQSGEEGGPSEQTEEAVEGPLGRNRQSNGMVRDDFWAELRARRNAEGKRRASLDEVLDDLPEERRSELEEMTDRDWDLKVILKAALEQVCRHAIAELGDVTKRSGVKADHFIADIARQLEPNSLVIVSEDTDFIQAWHHRSVIMQLKVDGARMEGHWYGLTTGEYGMPFLFKCALLGKRDKLRRQEGPANPWVLFNTVGGNPPGPRTADALGNQVTGHVAGAGNGSEAEYRRLFADFVRRVRERRAWTLGLDGILNLLREFVRRDRAIRCRFLSRVLDKNLMIYPEETPGSGGRKHVLNVYQEEYELGYDDGDYEGSLLEDVDYILHGRGLDDPLSLEHLV